MCSMQGDDEGFEKLLKEISVNKPEPPRTAPAVWCIVWWRMAGERERIGVFWSIPKICMLTVV